MGLTNQNNSVSRISDYHGTAPLKFFHVQWPQTSDERMKRYLNASSVYSGHINLSKASAIKRIRRKRRISTSMVKTSTIQTGRRKRKILEHQSPSIHFLKRNMSDDLLAKENEFHKLNGDLQLKTRNVMKTVDSIIHARANKNLFSDANQSFPNFVMEDAKTIEDIAPRINKQLRTSLIKSEIPLVECTDSEILKKDKNVRDKAVITLLRDKIDMLYKKLEAMQLEYNNKCDYYKELEVEKKKLDDIHIKLRNQIETLNDRIAKLECINSDTLSDYQVLSNENIVLRKDLEGLKKEIRILNQQSINLDVRLNRSLESNEKLRNALKCSHIEEKELRNQIRKLQEDKKLTIKNLEKQRSELLQVFKKQTLLLDNLKKQNIYLIANRQISLMKEDFVKLLEWKPQNISDIS